jgi:hypothetical protein
MSNNRLGHILFQSNGSGSAPGGGFDLQDSPKQREPPGIEAAEDGRCACPPRRSATAACV